MQLISGYGHIKYYHGTPSKFDAENFAKKDVAYFVRINFILYNQTLPTLWKLNNDVSTNKKATK